METLIVYPDSKEKLNSIKAFMKALNITFEEAKTPYNPEFVKKIQEGDEDIIAGRTKKIMPDDVWK